MKYIFLLLFISSYSLIHAQSSSKEIALKFITQLQSEKFDSAYLLLDDTINRMVNDAQLEMIWNSIYGRCGELSQLTLSEAKFKKEQAIYIVEASCTKKSFRMSVSVDTTKHKISGFYNLPTKQESIIPTYANLDKFTERKLSFGDKQYPLQGTLTLPNGTKPCAVVILVHGSGPNDRDETLNGNKIFRDIAWGLASKGIAVFRYDKRTFTHGQKIASEEKNGKLFGVTDEVTDDAVFAINTIAKNKLIDNSRIFLLGHSLGGMMAPQIAKRAPKIKGVILMAAPARSLTELLVEQVRYLSDDKVKTANDSLELELLVQKIKFSGSANLDKHTPADSLALNLSAYYWLSLNTYNQLKVASKLKRPFLVLQGERDYQVLMTDFNLWKQTLNQQNSQFISYPNANHLCIDGLGKPNPKEYEETKNVNKEVIDDIANWIGKIE
jgi:alpha-beta hydrolase superfamily lysophospholipase